MKKVAYIGISVLCAAFLISIAVSELALAGPNITGSVAAQNITGSGAQIIWTTDVPADSKVRYGQSSAADPTGYPYDTTNRCDGGGLVTSHCINLTGLGSSVVYYYRVETADASGSITYSSEYQFTSAASGGGGGGSCSSEVSALLGSGCHDMGNAYFNSAMDQYVNYGGTTVNSCSANYISGCTTGGGGGGGGGAAPATPSGFTATLSGSNVTLTWQDNSTNEDRFDIYRQVSGGSWSTIGQAGSNVLTYSDSPASGSYYYQVSACNSYGCSSGASASVTVSAADTQAPSTPGGLTATAVSTSQINLSWSAATDNVGVTGYKIYKNGTLLTSVSQSSLSYSDTSLSAGTSYSYTVSAQDAAGNVSAQSSAVSATTQSNSGDSSLLGHWKFDGNGTNEVAGKPSAVTVGSASFNSSGGVLGGYLYIPSSGNYAKVPYNSSYDLPDSFTVEFWFRQRADRSALQDLVYKGSPTNNYNFRVFRQLWNQYNYGPIITGYTATASGYWKQTSNPNQLTHNTWHHVAYTKSPSEAAYYLDGVLTHSFSPAEAAKTPATDIFIGSSAVDTDIDNLKIYNRALSSGEVSQSVSAGGGGSTPTAPSSLRQTGSTATSFALAWNDNSSNEDKFTLEREVSGTANWTLVVQTGANTTTYTDTGIASNTYYNYRIQSCLSGYGCSAYTYVYGLTVSSGSTASSTASSTTTTTSSTTTTSCSTAASSLLGSGCHDMGNAYFNSAMTQYVNYGGSSVYSCSANYISGCTTWSGGTTTPPPSTTTTSSTTTVSCPTAASSLLGSGCHDMGNAYFNGAMTQYVNYGGSSVYSCSTNFIYGCSYQGSTTTSSTMGASCPATPASILGSGCHDMGNAYFNSAMDQYVSYGGSTRNYCSTNYILGCTTGTSGGGSVTLTSPNGGECVTSGGFFGIAWNSPLATEVHHWSLKYSIDNGGTYTYIGDISNYSVRSYQWAAVGNFTQGRMKVEAWGPSQNLLGQDSSDGYFGVQSSCGSFSTSTPVVGIIPYAPTGLSATLSTNGADVYLRWTDNSGNYESEFRVYRRVPGGSWAYVTSLGANITSYTDFGRPQGTYEYRVTACGTYGCSTDSNSASVTVGTTTTLPGGGIPTVSGWGLSVDASGVSTIGISFTAEMDQTSYTSANFLLYRASDPQGVSVPIFIKNHPYWAEVVATLTPGAEYLAVAKAAVRSKDGVMLGKDYVCKFTALATGYITSCPSASGGSASTFVPALMGTVQGNVVDSLGYAVSGVGIHVFKTDYNLNFGAVTDVAGAFSLPLPAGEYYLEAFPPSGTSDYLRAAAQKFVVNSGETRTIKVTLTSGSQAAKILSGFVSDPSGPISNARIGAYNPATNGWRDTQTDASGQYVLKLGAGTWLVKAVPVDPAQAGWYSDAQPREVVFANDAVTETKILNFTVGTTDAKLTVSAVDDAGNPIPDAGITLDPAAQYFGITNYGQEQFRKTGASGEALFSARPGAYIVRGFTTFERGYINPAEQKVDLIFGSPKKLTFVFRKSTTRETASIKGTVRLDDGAPISAYVWAWSETGGVVNTRSTAQGEFLLEGAKSTRWHIGAGTEVNGYAYKSSEMTREAADLVTPLEIVLSRASDKPLPPAVSVQQTATTPVVAQMQDGAKVFIPAQAAASQGTLSTQVAQTSEVPTQSSERIVSAVYDVSIKDQDGNSIEQLQEEIEITIPYDEAELAKKGVKPEDVAPGYFDEATGAWIRLDNYTIDKTNGAFVARVKHLTRFALVAAADVTPPSAPATIKALANSSGITLSWTNPTSDFAHIKIYRSSESGKLGNIVANDIIGTSFTDIKNLNAGATYYYTVRAVDPAGNESVNADQAVVTAAAVLLPPGQAVKAALLRTLQTGVSGDDVKTLQELLLKENVYPNGLITGYFGAMTKVAVIRFQEKYAAEILTPNGLFAGSGIVGPATRNKMNSLLGAGSSAPAPAALPPGQAVKAALLRTLQTGVSGDDVKTLQELLLKENVYPNGLITGYFGAMTKVAVIRFQEKYAAEILTPNGLSAGSGIVGPATRAKLNQLLK